MRRGSVLFLTAVAVLGLAVPAAAGGSKLPPAIPDTPVNEFLYDMWFSPTPSAWLPTGTIVADSGFRPYPNGLPYAGFGDSLVANALFFGTPIDQLAEIPSSTMRNLYGDGVVFRLKVSGRRPLARLLLSRFTSLTISWRRRVRRTGVLVLPHQARGFSTGGLIRWS